MLYTDDVAQAIVSASDPDGDEVTLSFVWSVDGTEVPGTGDTGIPGTSATLASENYARGQIVTVTVTPHDGDMEGLSLSDEIEVSNTPPPAPSVALDHLNRCGALHYLGDGSHDEDVSAPDSASLNFDEAFTVELWLSPATRDATTPMFLFGQSNVQHEAYQLEARAGQLLLILPDIDEPIEHLKGRATVAYSLLQEDWSHVLLSYDQGIWRGFINGSLVLEHTEEISETDGLPFWLGTNPEHVNPTTNYEGYIHSVRMSKTASYSTDFTANQMVTLDEFPLRSNPESTVALWTFGPPADKDGQYEDLSGNGNTLSVNGTGYVDSKNRNSCPWNNDIGDGYIDLRCAVTEEHMDPDGDGLRYEFHWFAGNKQTVFNGHVHENTVDMYSDIYQEDRGIVENWSCQVSASDGKTSGLPGVAETTIAD
jgi:hypothetical protein